MTTNPKQGEDAALVRFREIERRLPSLLDELLDCRAYRRDERPAVPADEGVYLFSEEGVHRYVGRTRHVNRRLGQHIWESSGENSAPFAFNIAKTEANRAGAGNEFVGTRAEVAAHPDFEPYFLTAKQRIRAMDFRFVKVSEPATAAIFEVYAAIALATDGEFNLFDTH